MDLGAIFGLVVKELKLDIGFLKLRPKLSSIRKYLNFEFPVFNYFQSLRKVLEIRDF